MVEPELRGWRHSDFNGGLLEIERLDRFLFSAQSQMVSLAHAPQGMEDTVSSVYEIYRIVRPLLPTVRREEYDGDFLKLRQRIAKELGPALENFNAGYPKLFNALREAVSQLFDKVLSERQSVGLGLPASLQRSMGAKLRRALIPTVR